MSHCICNPYAEIGDVPRQPHCPIHGVAVVARSALDVSCRIEDARERLDEVISSVSGQDRRNLIAIDRILQDAKRWLGQPNAGLARYSSQDDRESPYDLSVGKKGLRK